MYLLSGKTWRVRIGRWLCHANWSTAYAGLLDEFLARLNQIFGPPLSRKSFDACFRIAVVYSLGYIAFLIAAEELSLGNHVLRSIAISVIFGLLAFYLSRLCRKRHALSRKMAGGKISWVAICAREQLIYLGIGAGIIALGFFMQYKKVGDIQIGTLAGIVGTLIGGGAIAGAVTIIPALSVSWAISLLIDVALEAHKRGDVRGTMLEFLSGHMSLVPPTYLLFGLFSIILSVAFVVPLINSLFDIPSWAASRWLMRRLSADTVRPSFFGRSKAILSHILIDCFIALVCLFGLAVVIVNFTDVVGGKGLWNTVYRVAMNLPYSTKGSIMTVMLLSTLVPTTLHLFFALYALAAIKPFKREWFSSWLRESEGGGEWGNRAIVSTYMSCWLSFALFVFWGATTMVLFGLDWLWLHLGWGLQTDQYPFWMSIFRAAEAFSVS